MTKSYAYKMWSLLLFVGSTAGQGILEEADWYVLPKIGVAPGFFTHRGHEHRVVPLGSAANPAIVCTDIDGVGVFPVLQPDLANTVVQQNACKIPKFNEIFTNRVLDVAVEVGRNMRDNSQLYFEFMYNRAKGNNCLYAPTENYAAPDGCFSCSTTSTGTILTTSAPTYQFSNYVAYGGYVGNRYYYNKRFICNRVGVWGGFKIGILHRKQVTACISIPDKTVTVDDNQYTFAATTLPRRNIFCSSNAVSGGLSFGLDVSFCERFAILVGVDVLASCPLQPNANANHMLLADPTHADTAPTIPSGFFAQPSNTFPGTTGVLLQVPVWVGLRWNWDFCNFCD